MSRTLLGLVLVTVAGSAHAEAQRTSRLLVARDRSADWAAELFDTKSVDFGVVATRSEVKRLIRVRNSLKEPIHIKRVATTCVCSGVSAAKNRLQPGEEAIITVTMNTREFKRRKDANVIVTFDAPKPARVVIPVTAYIRADVVFEPGLVQFGSIPHGKAASRTIRVTHTGRTDWSIRKLIVGNKAIEASFKEAGRSGNRIDYTLDVQLRPNASIGSLRTLITLVTNDQNKPEMPILVEAMIEPEFVVTPGIVALNRVLPGSKQGRRLVVRNTHQEPIEIERISPAGTVNYQGSPDKKHIQAVQVTITAPTKLGRFVRQYEIYLKGREKPVKFEVSGEVVDKVKR